MENFDPSLHDALPIYLNVPFFRLVGREYVGRPISPALMPVDTGHASSNLRYQVVILRRRCEGHAAGPALRYVVAPACCVKPSPAISASQLVTSQGPFDLLHSEQAGAKFRHS